MKRITACLSLLITVMACESDNFTYTPDELTGVFKPNTTSNLAPSWSCVGNQGVSFGPSVRLEKLSDTKVNLFSKFYTYDPNTQRNIESELSTNLTLKQHEEHFDLLYKDKVIGDYRTDRIYVSDTDNSKFKAGKILNIRIAAVTEKRFVMFREAKE
jgi:uncharacterized protein YcfL